MPRHLSSRPVNATCLGLLLGCALLLLPRLPAAAEATSPPALLLFSTADTVSLHEAVAGVTQAGGRVRHLFPPHAAIADLPEAAASTLAQDPRLRLLARTRLDPAAIPDEYGRAARDAALAWNELSFPTAPAPSTAGAPFPEPLVGDAGVLPVWALPPGDFGPAAAPPGASESQTSEYMLGSCAVSLIFLESNGLIDPQTENWTTSEQSAVVAECLAAMDWWVSLYPYTTAPLSFAWDYQYHVPTRYEPINRSYMGDAGLWIADAMTALGYPCTPSTAWTALHDYVNHVRDEAGTDWAFAVFLVDSSADADGRFADGWFAYAYFNGPCATLTYDNDGWGIGRMDLVLSHESGHIFGAGDEYCSPGYFCCDPYESYGYLNVENHNCVEFFADPNDQAECVMDNNAPAVCPFTRSQIGWRDSDSDGLPDLLDVAPTASITAYSPDPTDDETPTFTGSASVGFFPNDNPWNPGPDVTLNRLSTLQYRLDGGSWQACAPTDGAFDEASETYRFTLSPLSPGAHTIEVRAQDTAGSLSAQPYPSDTLTINPPSIDIAISADPLRVPSGGTIQLGLSATDPDGGDLISYLWDDEGAGGHFLPTETTTGPAYLAPENTSGGDTEISLGIRVTADPPKTATHDISVTVTYDFDGDGMPDYWEQEHALDQTNAADAALDADGDGLTNLQEFEAGTDPGAADTDGDGLPDAWELGHGLDPKTAADASDDSDRDGLTALQEYQHASDPDNRDTDGDGFGDGEEVSLGSDPSDSGNTPSAGHFPDVPVTGSGPSGADPFWAFHEIEACYRASIVSGYDDGRYHPEFAVSRDQMAVYVARTLAGGDANVPDDYLTPSFSDVAPTHWAFKYIEYAVERSIVKGYDDGTYHPSDIVDRGAMSVYVARSIVDPTGDSGLAFFERPALPTFPDVPTQFWCYTYVEYCAQVGIVHGYGDGLYYPGNPVTRDQMAVYITRAFDLPR